MTLCPVCGRSYEAGTLYCMDDGAALVPAGPPSASGELDRLLASTAAPAPAAPPVAPSPAVPTRSGGLVAVVAVLGVLVVGMLAVVLWQQQQTADAAAERAAAAEARAADAQRAADAAAADAEVAQQQRDAAEASAEADAMQTGYTGDGTTVWANSPGDGFLALRSGPTTASGTRLLKIPHGRPLTMGDCLPPTTTPGGRYGSWCRAVYAGTAGWVFDAFVSR